MTPFLRLVLIGASLVVIGAGLHLAASILNLVLLSLLLALTLAPLRAWLVTRGVPKPLGIGVTMLIALVGGVLLIVALGGSLAQMRQALPGYQGRITTLYADATKLLTQLGVDAEHALTVESIGPDRIVAIVQKILGGLANALGNGLIVLILVMLFLTEIPVLQPRVAGDAEQDAWHHRLGDLVRQVRVYVAMNGVFGLGAAIADLIVLLILGVDFAVVWGVLSFLLSFVPFGFVLSLIPPVALALLEFGWGKAIAVIVAYVVINVVADNVIKPKVISQGVEMSPLEVLLSFIFWGWLLGPVGAILAVPLTLVVKKGVPILMQMS